MSVINLSPEQIAKFSEGYEKLPNIVCPCCKKDTGRKEIGIRDYIFYNFLRERYY